MVGSLGAGRALPLRSLYCTTSGRSCQYASNAYRPCVPCMARSASLARPLLRACAFVVFRACARPRSKGRAMVQCTTEQRATHNAKRFTCCGAAMQRCHIVSSLPHVIRLPHCVLFATCRLCHIVLQSCIVAVLQHDCGLVALCPCCNVVWQDGNSRSPRGEATKPPTSSALYT